MLCNGDLQIHSMCIHSLSHLWIIDRSGSSKRYIWFLQWCWLPFHSNIVGGRWGIHCVFSSGKWVYRGLVTVVDFLWCSRQRWRTLSCWYWQWGSDNWCWCWSGHRSFGWCQSVHRWVRVMSLLGLGPNSRCRFMSTQSKQLLFEQQDMLF